MNKYIVKNCPACFFKICKKVGEYDKYCQYCQDCIIKKTINILLREKNNPFELPIVDEDERIHKCGKNELAREILKKWEIEVIEDAG